MRSLLARESPRVTVLPLSPGAAAQTQLAAKRVNRAGRQLLRRLTTRAGCRTGRNGGAMRRWPGLFRNQLPGGPSLSAAPGCRSLWLRKFTPPAPWWARSARRLPAAEHGRSSGWLVPEPADEVGQADAARQGGGERGGLAAVQPLQPELRRLRRRLGSCDPAGQQHRVGDADGHLHAEQADPSAACFLVGRLPGAGMGVRVPRGDVAAAAAGVLAAEFRCPDL